MGCQRTWESDSIKDSSKKRTILGVCGACSGIIRTGLLPSHFKWRDLQKWQAWETTGRSSAAGALNAGFDTSAEASEPEYVLVAMELQVQRQAARGERMPL